MNTGKSSTTTIYRYQVTVITFFGGVTGLVLYLTIEIHHIIIDTTKDCV